MSTLYVKLGDEDRVLLDKLAADAGAARGKPVPVSDIIRQLVREAAKRGKPMRIR